MAAVAAFAVSATMLAAGAFPVAALAEEKGGPAAASDAVALVADRQLANAGSAAGLEAQDNDALAPDELADGEYQVGVSLTQASAIDDQTMPTVFLKDTATVKVIDGAAWLVATLQPAYIMGGGPYFAEGLSFYADGEFSIEGAKMVVSGSRTTSRVVSYMVDPNDRYHHYPQDILGELPASATTNGGYMAVAMGSSQMSSSSLVLKLDWSTLSQVSAERPELPVAQSADKSALDDAVSSATAILKDQELASAYAQMKAGLEQELAGAQTVQSNDAATQAQVDAVAKSLHETTRAYQNADLKALYDEASAIDQSGYTAATRAELAAQLANAKAVLDDDASTRVQAIAARDALAEAVEALVAATVNKESLAAALEEARSYELATASGELVSSQKTTDSLKAAMQTAEAAAADDAATQSQVNDAVKALQVALNAWAKSSLETAIASAEGTEQGAKTDEAFQALQKAVKSAKNTLGKKSAARADHLKAAETLRAKLREFLGSADRQDEQSGGSEDSDDTGASSDTGQPGDTGKDPASSSSSAGKSDGGDSVGAGKSSAQSQQSAVAGRTYAAGSGASAGKFKVVTVAKKKVQGTVMFKKSRAPANAKKAAVPATVKIKGATYKVVSIASNAFSGHKKLTQVVVGKNVKAIRAKAFRKAPRLTKLVVKSKHLTTKKSVKNCLKGSKVKTVKVKVTSKSSKAKVKRAFKRFAGKQIAIK